MPQKTVFIFGAGASKADGLPIQSELLKEYFSTNPKDNFSTVLNGYFRVIACPTPVSIHPGLYDINTSTYKEDGCHEHTVNMIGPTT